MARITFYFFILILCVCSISSIGDVPIQSKWKHKDEESVDSKKDEKKQEKHEDLAEININTEKKNNENTDGVKTGDKNKIEKKIDDKKNKTVSSNSSVTITKTLINDSNIKTSTNSEIESGAVMRGIFVFVGITMICIMYIGFKTYFRKNNKKSPLIRKYGVKTRRSDIEMEPLPLEEDEEDETVFDLGNINNR